MVCFLALALGRTLARWMQLKGLGICARQLVNQMAGIKSVDVIVPVRCAEIATELRLREIATELRLRVVATIDPATDQRLAHLGLRLPNGTREISHGVPKISR